jgi:hydrogenase-1 operon protein HyaE
VNNSPYLDRLAERYAFLASRYGYQMLDADSWAAFAAAPGPAVALFAEDPAKVPETWDLTIILPEALRHVAGEVRVALLAPEAARKLAARYGIRFWPALLALRDGDYLGSIEGLKDWSTYARQLPELLAGAATRPPGIGIPVATAGTFATVCH